MHDYKFRGKCKNDGEWVYGDYVRFPQHSGSWMEPPSQEEDHFVTNRRILSRDMANVDPSTVGRYTGLPDKNGVEIYEGDIVRQFGGEMWELIYTVGWNADRCGFWLYCHGRPHVDLNNERPRLEVIGNVHENPDLLEGGEQRG